MRRRQFHISLALLTALLVLLIALLAGGSLWVLRGVHNQSAHTSAAKSVLEKGHIIALDLADQPVVKSTNAGEQTWADFSRLVNSLYAIEDGLQFVSVSRGGTMLFQEHSSALDGTPSAARRDLLRRAAEADQVRVGRRLLDVGTQSVPVVAFELASAGPDDTRTVVEVGMRKDTVAREEKATDEALRSMFTLSLITVSISFGICALLVVWMMHRENLRERQRRNEEHLAFSGVLANGIVHDFRNPMSSMRLDVQMLHKEAKKGAECGLERVGQLAERIRTTMDRMDKVFQEFLYLSKPSGDALEQTDLAACARECLDLLAPRLEHAGVRGELQAPDGPIFADLYPSAFRRALINVIINAEQFSPRGGVVKVRLFQSGGHAYVDVLDNGPGVPRSGRKRIFDMFHSTRPQGTGLGLFLARAAVERNGGTIKAMDNPEGGACFRIGIPQAPGTAKGDQGGEITSPGN